MDELDPEQGHGPSSLAAGSSPGLHEDETPSDDASNSSNRSRRRGARSVAASILGVLAVIGVLASSLAVWARATVLDSDNVAATVGDALAEPAVSDALAAHLSEQLFAAVEVDAAIAATLPPALERFVPAVAGGVQGLVERSLTSALENEDVQQRLSNVVRRAHAAAMRLLEGDGLLDGASVQDGEVTLNLLPFLERGLARLQEFGLLTDVELPPLAADGVPAEQIAALEAALERDLPEDFGQLVVYRSDTLAQAEASLESAQSAMAVAKRAAWVLIIVTVVLLVATMLIARDSLARRVVARPRHHRGRSTGASGDGTCGGQSARPDRPPRREGGGHLHRRGSRHELAPHPRAS